MVMYLDCEDALPNMLWKIKFVLQQKEDSVTYRWEARDRKQKKKKTIKQMNSFSEYVEHESEESKERSRKKKLYRKLEDELLNVFENKD